MINPEKMINGAKMMLGAPALSIELSDEQMHSLINDAQDSFILYSEIAKLEEKKKEFLNFIFNSFFKKSG